MTAFTSGDLIVALAIGLLIGVVVVAGFNSQQNPNKAALSALRKRMGSLYTITLFATGALPTAAMWLGASMRSLPTLLDSIVLIVLIGLGMIASYTLLGNVLKLTEECMSDNTAR
jgi:hypothetical protein